MIIIYLFLLIFILLNQSNISQELLETTRVWYYVLLPTLFPQSIIFDLIINNKYFICFINFIYRYLKNILPINYPISLVCIIISFIFGCPITTKLINDAVNNNQIDTLEANNLVYCFSNLSLPFVTLICISNNINVLKYYIVTFIIEFTLFTLINKKNKKFKHKTKYDKKDFIDVFINSITNTSQILLNILGIILSFKIISILLPDIFYPFIEVLGGLTNKSHDIKIIILAIQFLGLSLHMQIYYCYRKINYLKFLLIRIIIFVFSFIIFL